MSYFPLWSGDISFETSRTFSGTFSYKAQFMCLSLCILKLLVRQLWPSGLEVDIRRDYMLKQFLCHEKECSLPHFFGFCYIIHSWVFLYALKPSLTLHQTCYSHGAGSTTKGPKTTEKDIFRHIFIPQYGNNSSHTYT